MANQINYSGELFDLGIGSMNNKFGGKHILYVMKNGIYFTLQKFIDELNMILSTAEQDDKSEKRQLRLQFLQECNKFPEIRKLFQNFTGQLNGGEKIKSNDILITVAGGNIFTLFAQILITINSIGTLTETTKPCLKPFQINLNQLRQEIRTQPLFYYLNNIAYHPYSDFDYKLSPGKLTPEKNEGFELTDKEIKTLEYYGKNPYIPSELYNFWLGQTGAPGGIVLRFEGYLESIPNILVTSLIGKYPEGFILARVKSYTSCDTDELDLDKRTIQIYKQRCPKHLQNLYPQIFQQSYLYHTQDNDCLLFLQDLKKKKERIEVATKYNVETVKRYFKNIYSLTYDMDAIFQYISIVTSILNNKIQEEVIKQKINYKDIVNKFLNLQTLRDPFISKLTAKILETFIEKKEINTEKIIEHLAVIPDQDEEAKFEDKVGFNNRSICKLINPKIIIPRTTDQANREWLNTLKSNFNKLYRRNFDILGIKLTFNIINTASDIFENIDDNDDEYDVLNSGQTWAQWFRERYDTPLNTNPDEPSSTWRSSLMRRFTRGDGDYPSGFTGYGGKKTKKKNLKKTKKGKKVKKIKKTKKK
tara:strand:+ start:99 stop:1865 length:1767 start_codon:yes stop_codon:yes gene_type:complete